MSETRRVYTRAVVEFKKSLKAALGPILAGLAAIGSVLAAGGGVSLSLIAVVPLLYALIDSVWFLFNPILSIAPWKILYRPRFWQGAMEISHGTITAWRLDGKKLVIERRRKKPVKVNLEALSKKDRELAVTVLRERGYGNLEA
jgi:hypothetical protein